MYVDMWNRSEGFIKLKISSGVKPDYYDRISNLSKFADIVSFYRELSDMLQNISHEKLLLCM